MASFYRRSKRISMRDRKMARVSRLKSSFGPEIYDLVVHRRTSARNTDAPIPNRVRLIRPLPSDCSRDQLFLDHTPIPRDAWRYDSHDRILTWRGAYGGGHLFLTHDGRSASGNIGEFPDHVLVGATITAQFTCKVALNSGAETSSSGGKTTGFDWDTSSAAWQNADWGNDRLNLRYTITPGTVFNPATFTMEFEDLETQSPPWAAVPSDGTATMQLSDNGGQFGWNLTFVASETVPSDTGTVQPTGPDSVFPNSMGALEDAAVTVINGAFAIDDGNTICGLQGVRATPMAAGLYRVDAKLAPFGVFSGRLTVGGTPVKNSSFRGDTLHWRDLPPAHQELTGLPETGCLRFVKSGNQCADPDNRLKARRLGTSAAIAAVEKHKDLHPVETGCLDHLYAVLDSAPLTMAGLLAMTPYTNASGQWVDAVQTKVTADMSEIMNSAIPTDIWSLLFPGQAQPTLTGELATVANSPVPGGADPTAWYQSLATAVLTQGMANGSDQYTQYMNGPRAGQWLKHTVANSTVYKAHAQLLFNYEWGQKNPTINDYLQDQINNSSTYSATIDQEEAAQIADINKNVVPSGAAPSNVIPDLISQVQDAATYAKTNNLFWAYAFYIYNTTPSILENIAIQLSIMTGSDDSTVLTRWLQQNSATLTALDPSNYFAQQYITTLNTYLAMNVLPSLFGFDGDVMNYDIVLEYLNQFVQSNLNNTNTEIAAQAANLQELLADHNAPGMLQASLEAIIEFADAAQELMQLPFIAGKFVTWFSAAYPKFSNIASVFGGVLIGGISGLAVFNLFMAYKSWDKMDAAEKAQIVTATVELGTQILAAMVIRGVRIGSIFLPDSFSFFQRAAAIGKILATGDAAGVDEGMTKIGNRVARWLGGKSGNVDPDEAEPLLGGEAAEMDAEASWTAKVFGANLEEFMATRIGPVFIIVGIALSIFMLAEGGETNVEIAANAVNIVGGALAIFAMAGEWFGVEAASLLASIMSFAGVLAVVAALVGVALMLYELFHKPPDPVQKFVDDYVAPAGLKVSSACSAIDYALRYADANNNNLMMIGFSLGAGGSALICNTDGSITTGAATLLPDTVWQVATDGTGMSQIFTVTQPDAANPPVLLILSAMNDNSVSFQPSGPVGQASTAGDGTTIVTQTWMSTPQGDAQTTTTSANGSDTFPALVSLPLTFQPVNPDASGIYAPSGASGWLEISGGGVQINATTSTSFTLAMSAMAPNYMTMDPLCFILNSVPIGTETFGASFGVQPSTPISYAETGTLPAFLSFDTATGIFSPNGQSASTASTGDFSVTATNPSGKGSAAFTITVAATCP